MPRPRFKVRPVIESLDQRLALSVSHPAAPVHEVSAAIARAARAFTAADLQAYADAYLSKSGGRRYNPAYDFNGDGRIGREDVTPILKGLASSTPRVPFRLKVELAPGEQVVGHHPANSGGVTRRAMVTVVGRTTPNSIIFTDPLSAPPGKTLINFQFQGPALVSDSKGRFSLPVPLAELADGGSLTTAYFLVQDPFGRSAIRAFPILRIR